MLSFVTFFKVLQIFGLQFSPSHYAFAATVCDGASCANDEADTTQTFFIQKRAGLVGKHDVKGKDAEVENAHLEKIIRDAEMQDPTCKFETLICGCGGATPPPTPVPPTPVPPTPSPTPVPMNWVYANGDFTEASGGIQLAQPGHSHDGAVTQQESAAWTAAYFTLADGPASFEFSCTASTDDNLHVGLTSRQQNFETRQHWADVEYAAECHYGRQNGPQAIQFWWTQYSDSGLDLQNRQPGNIEGPWNESTRIKIAYNETDGRVHGYVDDVEYITYDVYDQDVAGQGYTELMPALVGRVTGHGILNAVWTTPTPLTALNQRNNHLRELVKEKETQDPRCLLPDMICGCADGAATPPPTPPPTPSPTPTPTPAPTMVPSTSELPMSDVACSVQGDSYGGASYSCANMYTQSGGYGHSWLTSDCHSQSSCMDTAWFMVDLQGNRYIDTIKIWPRSPPDQYRSSEYEILISDTPTTGTRGTAFAQASEGFTQVATNAPMGDTNQEYVHDVQQSAQYVMFHALQWNTDNNGNQFDGLRGAGVHYMKFVASGLSGSM